MSTTENHETGVSKVYELSYLLLPSIPEENLPQVVIKLQETINKNGGEKLDGEDPFLHELSYEMTKVVGASRYVVKNAYIGWIKFELGHDAESENHPMELIKNEIELMPEVLRFLLVKAEKETRFTFESTRVKEEEQVEAEEVEAGEEVVVGEVESDTPEEELASDLDGSEPKLT